jgi:hypothetical protein
MKKLSFLMIAAFAAVSSMFVSCTKDDPENPEPSIDVSVTYADQNNVPQLDGSTIEATEGMIANFKITFNMGVEKLKEVHMKSTIGGKTFNVLDSVGLDKGLFNTGAKKIDFTYTTNFGVEDEVLTFSAIDVASTPVTTTFTITLKSKDPTPVGEFIIKEAILMGGQKNATSGSFYSVALGKVLTIGAATSQPADVDLAYFYGATNQATIASPADTDAQTISYGATKMSSWGTKNKTLFFLVEKADGTKPAEWWNDNIEKATDLTKAAKLAKGNVVVYKTAKGTKGAFVVEDIATGDAGSIKINLINKVQ